MTEAQIAFERYAELKMQMKEMETELKALQPILLEHIPDDATVKGNLGSYTKTARVTWEYPSHVTSLEEELKEAQARSKQEGTATQKKGEPYVIFKEAK